MEAIDPKTAQQVWQRVRGGTPRALAAELEEMIAGEWTDAATYLALSRQYNGLEAGMLRKMFQQEQAHAACLKGIYTMLTGEKMVARRPAAAGRTREQTLRSCYGREMHCLARYEQYAEHPEFGAVFARLAQEEREHCHFLLQLLGK